MEPPHISKVTRENTRNSRYNRAGFCDAGFRLVRVQLRHPHGSSLRGYTSGSSVP